MTVGRALDAGAMTGIGACLGVIVTTYVSGVGVKLAMGQAFPFPTPGHGLEMAIGVALLLTIFVCVAVAVFSPYAFLRESLNRPMVGDAVVHLLLAVAMAALVSALTLGGDLRAFAVAFAIFAIGGIVGLKTFRSALLRSAQPATQLLS